MGGLVLLILVLLIIWGILGWVGSWLAQQRRRSPGVGFAFGFFLGPIGLVIVALLPYGNEPAPSSGSSAPWKPQPERTSPSQSDWNAGAQWNALGEEADSLDEGDRAEAKALAATALSTLRHHSGLRASLFLRETNGKMTLVLLCDTEVMSATASPEVSIPLMAYMHQSNYEAVGNALAVVIRPREEGGGKELTFDQRARGAGDPRVVWSRVLSGTAPLTHFCAQARTRHWVEVIEHGTGVAKQPGVVVETRAGGEAVSAGEPTTNGALGEAQAKLAALKSLRESDLISEEEYAERKRAVLDTIA